MEPHHNDHPRPAGSSLSRPWSSSSSSSDCPSSSSSSSSLSPALLREKKKNTRGKEEKKESESDCSEEGRMCYRDAVREEAPGAQDLSSTKMNNYYDDVQTSTNPPHHWKNISRDESSPPSSTPHIISTETLLQSLTAGNIQHELFTYSTISHLIEPTEASQSSSYCYCKNLLLKDKKENLFLLVAERSKELQLNSSPMRKCLGAQKALSMVNAEGLLDFLKVAPGSVSPFCLLNAKTSVLPSIQLVLDDELVATAETRALFHPLDGEKALNLCVLDMVRFLQTQMPNLKPPLSANLSSPTTTKIIIP